MKKIADQTIPFIFSLRSLGIFGSRYDPRVVWVGITPYNDLALLMKNFQDECRSIGFEPDRQNLVPHLTIGRVKELKDKIFFRNTIDQFRDISSSEMNAGIIFLYESILKKEGPVYLALNSFQLQKK
jgi:2'-5' RNA ligase